MLPRNPTREVRIGTVTIGGGHPVAVQSMTATHTQNIDATVAQVRALAERALEVIEGGRPICPLCHLAIDPSGHVCPASNGHHRA